MTIVYCKKKTEVTKKRKVFVPHCHGKVCLLSKGKVITVPGKVLSLKHKTQAAVSGRCMKNMHHQLVKLKMQEWLKRLLNPRLRIRK